MALFVYNLLMLTGAFLAFPIILPFLVTSLKRRKTVFQRLSFSGPRPTPGKGPGGGGRRTIWVHALSLGEVISAVPLVMEIERCFGKDTIVFSASTLTGFETAMQRLDAHVRQVFFFPYDFLFSVARVVNRVDPDLVIIVETDLWPNFMARLRSKRIPAMLVNARLSDRSAAGYRRIRTIVAPLLNTFRIICVQSPDDAERFLAVGALADRVTVTGNLKFDQPGQPLSDADVSRWRRLFGLQYTDQLIVAGSTHPGEEHILLTGLAGLFNHRAGLKLVIAPRDPQRAAEVKALCAGGGLKVACLSELEARRVSLPADVIVIDRIGILSQIYALGDITFIGGSLVAAGGHNPLEPAVYGKPVLFGPDMSDFRLIAALLVENGGALQVADQAGFTRQVERLLGDAGFAQSTGRHAARVFADHSGAVHRTMSQVVTVVNGGINA
jgi:3-deoxy-D-manno-octulosonic-acid transferase